MKTSMTVFLPVNLLLAVHQAASKDDARQCLNGVAVQRAGSGLCLAATQGHMLVAARVPAAGLPGALPAEWPDEIIIPNSLLVGLYAKNGDVELTVSEADDDGGRWLTVRQIGRPGRTDLAVASKFPDWRRVVPRTVSGDTAKFDPELLARLQKAADHASVIVGRSCKKRSVERASHHDRP